MQLGFSHRFLGGTQTMHLLIILVAVVIVAAICWAFWGVFVFLMIVSTTMAASMFFLWSITEFVRSIFVKYEGLNFLWFAIALAILWFALGYNCDLAPVIIGSLLGAIAYGYATWAPERPVQPHELEQ
jgi:hypothetical protein